MAGTAFLKRFTHIEWSKKDVLAVLLVLVMAFALASVSKPQPWMVAVFVVLAGAIARGVRRGT